MLNLTLVFPARSDSYPLALSLIAEGKINVKPLITHRFKLEDALAAFEVTRRGEGIKVIIECDNESKP